jgi:hypothetical protein
LGPTPTKHTKKINPKKIAADFASCPADEWSEIAFGNGFLHREKWRGEKTDLPLLSPGCINPGFWNWDSKHVTMFPHSFSVAMPRSDTPLARAFNSSSQDFQADRFRGTRMLSFASHMIRK